MKKILIRTLCISICFILLLSIVSCAAIPTEDDIIGTWIMEDTSLKLSPYEFSADGEWTSGSSSGYWEINGSKIKLREHEFYTDSNGRVQSRYVDREAFVYKNGKLVRGVYTYKKIS